MEVACQLRQSCHFSHITISDWFEMFWFLIALLLYPKSTIFGLSFLDPKDICLPNQFSRGSWQERSVSTYLTWCQRRNLIANFQFFIYLPGCKHFMASIFCKVSLALLNRIQAVMESIKYDIAKPWKPSIIDRSKWY